MLNLCNLTTAAAILAAVLSVSTTTVCAQTSITLGASSSTLVFSNSKTPGVVNLNLGSLCPHSTSFCHANGMGDSGFFLVNGSSSLQLTQTSNGWSVSESRPLTFEFCSNSDCRSGGGKHSPRNTVFLSGSLQLLDLQLLPGSKPGTFDYLLSASLDDLKGPLAGDFPSRDGVLDFTIQLNENLSSLEGHPFAFSRNGEWSDGYDPDHKLCVPILGGKVSSIDPTPEPGSILLFGTGLLVLAGMFRRRHVLPARSARI